MPGMQAPQLSYKQEQKKIMQNVSNDEILQMVP